MKKTWRNLRKKDRDYAISYMNGWADLSEPGLASLVRIAITELVKATKRKRVK